MIDPETPPADDAPLGRLAELLADRALQGLSEGELSELRLLDPDFEATAQAIEAAVAEASLTFEVGEPEALPAPLRDRLERSAASFFAPGPRRPLIPLRIVPWLGWVAAAASLFFAIQARRVGNPVPGRPREPTLAERFSKLPRVPLSATDHPLAKGAGGALAWSGDGQEGVLSLLGLAENDPARGIYQLWIFDATRDDRFPVDGGTFTVRDSSSPTLVPIRPSLPVRLPTLFAVTLEPPGGVVVSDRKRLLLTGDPPPR